MRRFEVRHDGFRTFLTDDIESAIKEAKNVRHRLSEVVDRRSNLVVFSDSAEVIHVVKDDGTGLTRYEVIESSTDPYGKITMTLKPF